MRPYIHVLYQSTRTQRTTARLVTLCHTTLLCAGHTAEGPTQEQKHCPLLSLGKKAQLQPACRVTPCCPPVGGHRPVARSLPAPVSTADLRSQGLTSHLPSADMQVCAMMPSSCLYFLSDSGNTIFLESYPFTFLCIDTCLLSSCDLSCSGNFSHTL